LPGFYEETLLGIARESEEKARAAFDAHLENLEANADWNGLIATARRGLSLFPYTLSWLLALMRAHRGLGQWDAALDVFKEIGKAARRDNELVPDAARHLARQIRREREAQPAPTLAPQPVIAPPQPQRHIPTKAADNRVLILKQMSRMRVRPVAELPSLHLPQTWTQFFGRDEEIANLTLLLTSGERFVTMTGMVEPAKHVCCSKWPTALPSTGRTAFTLCRWPRSPMQNCCSRAYAMRCNCRSRPICRQLQADCGRATAVVGLAAIR
jgi:hypothetical protein